MFPRNVVDCLMRLLSYVLLSRECAHLNKISLIPLSFFSRHGGTSLVWWYAREDQREDKRQFGISPAIVLHRPVTRQDSSQ